MCPHTSVSKCLVPCSLSDRCTAIVRHSFYKLQLLLFLSGLLELTNDGWLAAVYWVQLIIQNASQQLPCKSTRLYHKDIQNNIHVIYLLVTVTLYSVCTAVSAQMISLFSEDKNKLWTAQTDKLRNILLTATVMGTEYSDTVAELN